MRVMCRLGMLALMVLACGVPLQAQPYPSKPIRIVVPYAAGGSVDPMARLVADRLSKAIGQSVVIENRPGAGGNIGIEAVVRGAQDGYTLLATPSAVAINPSLYGKVPYDLENDLAPLGLINRNAMIVMVNPASGVKSLGDLVARAKLAPTNYAISGNGTLDHLVCEHLRASAGLDMVKINYLGVPKAITATSAERSPHLPDVPTMSELGYKDFVMYGWTMLFAPAGVPRDIVGKLHDDVARVVAQPDVTKIIADMGSEAQALSLDQLKTYVRQEAALFAGIVKSSGARVD